MVEILPLIKSWNDNSLKKFPRDGWWVSYPRKFENLLFCPIYDLNKLQSNFGSSNVSFSNPSESSKTAVGPEFSAIYFMHF